MHTNLNSYCLVLIMAKNEKGKAFPRMRFFFLMQDCSACPYFVIPLAAGDFFFSVLNH